MTNGLERRLGALESEVATMGDALRLSHHTTETRHGAILERLEAYSRRFEALEGAVKALPRTVAEMLAEGRGGQDG